MTLSRTTRQRVISAYRFHCGSPNTQAAAQLVAVATAGGWIARKESPPGMVLQLWATERTPPLWAVYAAATWLRANRVEVTDRAEREAFEEALSVMDAQTPDASSERG
ncbi:hypothetical protein [uncultured Thiodictyon sp.]|uniref:hypothetical protein n=1 Tax=uncultured Thiodictyon sp. TaxID=1846217 RepID=UPI0025F51372|nr:hypothetical protein [uncultured Thiodictyon sp.]